MLLTLLAWFLVSHKQQIRSAVTNRDSLAYWAAAKLLLQHQDPYSASAVLALQRSQGYVANKPLVLRTPPWSLWMVLPLGLLDPYWAWVIWLAILLASLFLATRLSWKMYGDSGRPPSVFLVAAYLFAPVPACLVVGQLGMVMLLGTVLFFHLEERHPFWAGAILLVPFAKPHLFPLLWPILAVRALVLRRWSMLGGFAAALAGAAAIALLFDPDVFFQYQQMMTQSSIQYEFIPAVSGVLRLIFFRRFFWVQFLPMTAGLLWCFFYYYRNRRTWSWREHGPAILVVSVLCAPYAWMTDEAVLLPAILQGVVWVHAKRTQLRLRSQLILAGFIALNTLLLLLLRAKIPFSTGIYFWSSMVWASWYWYASRFRETPLAAAISQDDSVCIDGREIVRSTPT